MSNQEVLDTMSVCNEMCELREKALRQAGEALDSLLQQLMYHDSIHIVRDVALVDIAHKALNSIAAIVGTPWRKR